MKFDPNLFIKTTCTSLQEFKGGTVLVTVSGGVDSSTSAALIQEAGIDSKLVFIDTGFLRTNEAESVKRYFGSKLIVLNKSKLFYKALKNCHNSEEKREVFRHLYFKIIKEYVLKNNIPAIVQGTQFHKTSTKRYHNSPTKDFLTLPIKVIEPVRGLSKPQIRLLAKKLGLPDEVVNRRPFPGPGLLIRFGGNYTPRKLDLIRKATGIIDKLIEKDKNKYKRCYQIFPYICEELAPYVNKESRGAKGHIVLIRALEAKDLDGEIIYTPFILPGSTQEEIVGLLMKIDGISRVCFDMTPKLGSGKKVKPGGTIEYA
ncbi:MAG: GMP synthase (glutamine-hydrolysing) [Parcubacteria bacterium C7867-005]|nr:MAG: GMP synthase (glutamine-hydrolysing) [Parcubacteria bacterium C7867-005]